MKNRVLTTENLLYVVIFIFSLLFRMLYLGRFPLTDSESNLALQALDLARGGHPVISGQPGVISLTSLLFFIFGASDFFARFWPALIGSCAALLPILFKKYLGKAVTVMTAIFLAIDPVLVAASKTAFGNIFAIIGIIAGIGFWLKRKPTLAGIAFGLAFTSGAALWPGILVTSLSLGIILNRFQLGVMDESTQNELPEGNKQFKWVTILSAAVTAVLVSTMFMTHPAGISAIGSSLIEYLKSWNSGLARPFYTIGILWLVFQFPGVLLGVWGLINGFISKLKLALVLGFVWLVSAILIFANPSTSLIDLTWLSIPMWILAATQISRWIEGWQVESRVVLIAQIMATIALILFSGLNLVNLTNSDAVDQISLRNRLIGGILPLILLVIVTFLLAWGWSEKSSRRGLLAGIGILLIVSYFGTAWKAAGLGSRWEGEFWKGEPATSGMTLMMSSISDISRWNTGQADRIDIKVVGVELPSIRWALRDFQKASYDPLFDPSQTPSLVLTADSGELTAQASYRGQKIVWAVQPDFSGYQLKDWLKWFLFRTGSTQKTELILWARNDLFAGSQDTP